MNSLPITLPAFEAPEAPEALSTPSPSILPRIELLSLPPIAQFDSFEALKESAKLHALRAGYAFVEGKGSKTTKKGDRKIKFLTCSHFGKLDQRSNEANRRRLCTTAKTGCEVRIRCKEEVGGT